MEENKKNRLYYNYNEKFGQGHHCSTKKLYVLDVKALIELTKEIFKYVMVYIVEEPDLTIEDTPKISCNAISRFS